MERQEKRVSAVGRASLLSSPTPGKSAPATAGVSHDSNREIPAQQESLTDWLGKPGILLALLGLLTAVLYAGTLSFPFVWDDNPQIVNNPIIRTWSNVPRAFGSDMWYHTTRHQVYYRPLFTSWSILNYSLFQLKPWGWHLTTVLVHFLAVVVVYFLARKLGLEYWTSALAALIFALHPAHIECAAWISAASDAMVTIFFALAFLAFLNSRGEGTGPWLSWRLGSILLLACALFTKEMGLTFAAVVALYVWMFPDSPGRSLLQRASRSVIVALPYAMVTIAYLMVRKLALHHVAGTFDPQHGLVDMMLTWPLVLYNYLRILVLPVGLTGLYYTPYVVTPEFTRFVLPLLVLAVVAAGIWFWSYRTNDKVIAFFGLWMVVTLIPALYLRNFTEGDFVRDRYLYLPSAGFAVLLAKAIRMLPGVKSLSPRILQVATACALGLVYVAGTYSQQVYWGSDLLIFYRGHTLYPESDYATMGFASELTRRGGYDRAIDLLQTVIHRHSKSDSYAYLAYFGLAGAYIRSGDKVRGREMLDKAVTLAPAYLTSEVSKIDLAGLYGQLGDYDRALALCSDVLRTDPNLYSALYNCGNINFLSGHYAEAEKLLSQAVRAAPDQANPNYFLGRVYLQTGRPVAAEESFRKAIAFDPNVYDYHLWYGRVLAMQGNIPEARRELSAALAVKSDGAEAKADLVRLATAR